MSTDIRQQLETALRAFSGADLRDASIGLLESLGYGSEKTIDLDGSPEPFLSQFANNADKAFRKKALFDDWKEIHLLFQLTDEELSGQHKLFVETGVKQGLMGSYLFFALRLEGESYARGKLAQITRQLNRIFPMPVMVIFEYQATLSIAVINRRRSKRDTDKDVLGKVTLIQDISLSLPHRGHLDILASFSIPEIKKKRMVINSFETLHAAWEEIFNVELLNRRFYQKIQNWFFWAVQEVRFPHGGTDEEEQRNRIAMIRMLTRVIFCWFAKEKGLLPARLFDSKTAATLLADFDPGSIKDGSYYRAFLQNLFFAVLSIPPKDRKLRDSHSYHGRNNHYMDHSRLRHRELFADSKAPESLFADIAFLNGGLFECLDYRSEEKGKNTEIRVDGFSDNPKKQAFVPNVLFFGLDQAADLHEAFNDDKKTEVSVDGLFTILESFKFTVTENTPIEEEIALDPELLGRIFENLLAEYNPETEKTARKETGSFYTPRTIVDYMVNESLKAYLQKVLCEKLPSVSHEDAKEGLDILFSYREKDHAFTKEEKSVLLDAIYEVTILDPACGSGAFPMGMLQKLVYVLEKLDHGHDHWKQRILKDTPAPMKEETRKLLERSSADFLWKLGLIQRCIYGIDIQPIAVQIAKLRCFISLLVDFSVDERQENKGVPALPNLDFKFIAADTLIKPPGELEIEGGLMGLVDPFYERFAELAEDYFFVRDHREKKKLREQIEKLIEKKIRERESSVRKERGALHLAVKTSALSAGQARLQDAAKKKNKASIAKIEREVALWESYRNLFAFRNAPVRFFDLRYFFPEIKSGFDIVIGNPPYVQIQKFPAEKKEEWLEKKFRTYKATADIYCLFFERGAQLLKTGGHLCYITSNKWMRADYGDKLRAFLSSAVDTRAVLDFGMAQNFGAATTYTSILNFENRPSTKDTHSCYAADDKSAMLDLESYFQENAVPMPELSESAWVVVTPERYRIKKTVEAQGVPLEDWDLKINYGIKTGLNDAFYLTQEQRDDLIAREPQAEEIIVPLLRGRYVGRYKTNWDQTWMINSHNGVKERGVSPINIPGDYPVLFDHLKQWEKKLIKRQDKGDHWSNLRNCAYIEEFRKPKIIYQDIAINMPFFYDDADHYFFNNTCWMMAGESNALPYLAAVFNSSLFRFCFRDNFPEYSGNACRMFSVFFKKIPIKKPDATTVTLFETLVAHIQFIKADTNQPTSNGTPPTVIASFLEALIDACVMEIYFTDHMAEKKLTVIDEVCQTIKPFQQSAPDRAKWQQVQSFYETVNAPKHPIRDRLMRIPIDSPDLLRVIKEEGKV